MSKLKVCSLFSGIGGFESGVFNAIGKDNVEVVFASEIDKYAAQAYEVLYGDKPHGDITKVNTKNIPDHDLLAAGFPCPAFSQAGKGNGMENICENCSHTQIITYREYKNGAKCEKCNGHLKPKDERGLLFFEIARVAEDKKTKFLMLENVKGLINANNGEALRTILETLSDIGYTVDFDLLNSKHYNVPQNRERVIIIGIRDLESEEWNVKRKDIIGKAKSKLKLNKNIKTFNFDYPTNSTVNKTIRDILEDDVDEKYYISEDKTRKLIEQLTKQQQDSLEDGSIIDPMAKGMDGLRLYNEICPTLNSRDYKEPRKVVEMMQVGMLDIKGNDCIRRVYDPDGLSPTLTTMEGGLREPKIVVEYDRQNGIGKELDIAHTLNSSDWRGLNRNQKQNAVISIGNVNPSGNGMNGEVYSDEGLSPTITTNKGEGTKILTEVRAVLTPDREEKRQQGRRFKEDGEPAFTVNTQDKHGVALKEILTGEIKDIIAKTRPNEEIGITFKDNGDIRPHRMDEKKSGISELNINHEDNQTFTVTSSHAPKIYGYTTQWRIRKLTPLECFRLQGFPDEYYHKLVGAGISNSQLYKMAGNAVTTNVIEAVFENLMKYIDESK